MTSPVVCAAAMLDWWRTEVRDGPPPVRFKLGDGFDSVRLGPGRVVVVGGPPGTGKTALALQWVTDALREAAGASALIINVEMGPAALLERILARLTGIPLELIAERRTEASPHGERLEVGFATLETFAARLHFLEPPFTWPNIVKGLKAVQPKLLMIDYLQRIGSGNATESDNARAAVSASMESARRTAEAGVAVLALSAVGRLGDGKGKYTGLGLGSFRESSEIEYGADCAYVLTRDNPDDESALTLRHVKCRHGRPLDLPLRFHGEVMSFSTTKTTGAPPAKSASEVRKRKGKG